MKQLINDIKEVAMMAILILWIGSFICVMLTAFYNLQYTLVSGTIFLVTTGIINAYKKEFKMLEE